MRQSILIFILLLIPIIAIAQTANDFFDKAINEFHKGNYKEAIANFQKCIQLEPVDAIEAEAYANIAAINNLYNNHEKAIKNSSKSIEINALNIKAYFTSSKSASTTSSSSLSEEALPAPLESSAAPAPAAPASP